MPTETQLLVVRQVLKSFPAGERVHVLVHRYLALVEGLRPVDIQLRVPVEFLAEAIELAYATVGTGIVPVVVTGQGCLENLDHVLDVPRGELVLKVIRARTIPAFIERSEEHTSELQSR